MSIADKKVFLTEIERSVGDVLTVTQSAEVMRRLAEHLDSYQVEAVRDGGKTASLDLLQVYIDAKRIEGRSEKTIERYRYIISKMLDETGLPVKKLTVYHLRAYLMQMKERGIADSTICGIREIFCAFFGWLQREGLIEQNPTANLNAVKCPKVIRKPFSAMEIERLKESCASDRDKAIICFLLSTGCRISEVCALNREDIDYASMSVKVCGKGDKERTVFLDDVCGMILRRYLSGRTDTHRALFIGKGSERLTPGGVRFVLKNLERRTGVENVHPHRFRRTLATNLINRGMPIQEVAIILGHDKIDTTMKYVFISSENVKNAYRKYA